MSWGMRFDSDKVLKEVQAAATEGLRAAAEELSAESQKLCPKDRGYNGGLVSTHYETVDPETLTMRVGYKARHSWYQHEKREYKHKPGEQAKFVEQPLMQNGPRYLRMIADRIRQRLSR